MPDRVLVIDTGKGWRGIMRVWIGVALVVGAVAGFVAFAYHSDAEKNANWKGVVSEVDACAPMLPYKADGRTGCWDPKTGLAYFPDGSKAKAK